MENKMEICNEKGEYIEVDCEDVEGYVQTIFELKSRIKDLECYMRANQYKIDEQKLLVQRFKNDLIKGVINFTKDDFIKGIIEYQFENSRGFKNGR